LKTGTKFPGNSEAGFRVFEVEHGDRYVGNMERTNDTECGVHRAVSIKITVVMWGTGT
jgi:hypothetical protein